MLYYAKTKQKHCVQTLLWPTICLSAKKKKKKNVFLFFFTVDLEWKKMANYQISAKCRGKNYNLCFRSDHCFVKYTYGNYFITKQNQRFNWKKALNILGGIRGSCWIMVFEKGKYIKRVRFHPILLKLFRPKIRICTLT